MKNLWVYLLILFLINICALTLTVNDSAMATSGEGMSNSQSAQNEETTKKPTDKLTIEKNANGPIIIRQNPARKKKPAQ